MKPPLMIFFLMVMINACQNNEDHSAHKDLFTGNWTYRSLLNSTNISTEFDSLEFATASVYLEPFGIDSLQGKILWAMDTTNTIFNGLNLSGKFYSNDSSVCYFLKGFGTDSLGTAGWQYNYQGYLVPTWPEGIDQATVLVGSVVRVKKHSCDSSGQNCHPAGLVATTYMVKK